MGFSSRSFCEGKPELFLETPHFPFKNLQIVSNHGRKASDSGQLTARGTDDEEREEHADRCLKGFWGQAVKKFKVFIVTGLYLFRAE